MKKILTFVLAAALLVSLTACGGDAPAANGKSGSDKASSSSDKADKKETKEKETKAKKSETDVTIKVNVTDGMGKGILNMAISPTGKDEWRDNLDIEWSKDGMIGATEITYDKEIPLWDITCKDADGTKLDFIGVDFTELEKEVNDLYLMMQDGSYTAYFIKY